MLGYKTRLSFGKPADIDNSADEKAMRSAYSYQVRIEGAGHCALTKFIVHAHEDEEWGITPPSDDRSQCSRITCCPPDPFEYVMRCGAPQIPVLQNETVAFAFGFRLAFRFEPGSTYTLYGETVADGVNDIVGFPNDIYDVWPDPDGWYQFNIIDIVAQFPSLVIGDSIEFWMVEQGCGLTRTTDRVTMTYTG
jgi:hypothetical protein